MKIKTIMPFIAAAFLVGCAGANYAIENYTGVNPVSWKSPTSQKNYRFFDKPAENRLMVTLGFGDAAAQGFGQGITLGAADTRTPEIVYQDAAIEWLKSTGRNCVATNTFLVIEPQYEVRYNCGAIENTTAPTENKR